MSATSSSPALAENVPANSLRKNALDLRHAIVMSVAVMSPAASIFFNTIPQAGLVGAAIPLCYVIGFVVALLVANQFSELSRELPSSGSAYTFVTVGLGPRPGFLTGWVGILAIALGVPYSFILMSANVHELILRWFNLNLHWSFYFVLAIGIVFAVSYSGIRHSLRLDLGFVLFELGICLVLAALILFHVGNSNGLTVAPFTTGVIPKNGDLTVGIILAVLSFIGFESAATLGEETRDPHRNIPRAVYGSMFIVGIFYVIMAYAATVGYGLNNMTTGYANDTAPFDTLGRHFGGNGMAILIDIVGIIGFFSAALAIVNGGARILYAVGRDGLLPKWTAWTHPIHKTPGAAIAALCVFGLVFGIPLGLVFAPINAFAFLGTMDAIFTLIIYLLVNIACMRFFLKHERGQFHIIKHGIFPVSGILITGGILVAAVASPGAAPLSYIPLIVGIWLALGIGAIIVMRKQIGAISQGPTT